MKKKLKLIGFSAMTLPLAAFADTVNVSGNISTSGGNIIAQNGSVTANDNVTATTGRVFAGTYLQSTSYVNAGTFVTAASYISSNTYITAPQIYTNGYLRVGAGSTSPGTLSGVIGAAVTNNSYSSLVVGRYNLDKAKDGTTTPTAGSWQANDPLFVAGNGADAAHLNNAFTIYKDGTITMGQAQGDISMGQFQ